MVILAEYRNESIRSLVKALRVCVRGKSSARSYSQPGM